RLRADFVLGERFLVRVHAHAATVDRRHRERGEFEVDLLDARPGHDVHAQAGAHRRVFLVAHEVGEAIIDVVHRHDRGRGARAVDLVGAEYLGRTFPDRVDEWRVARGDRARERDDRDLLRAEARRTGFAQHGFEVEAQVLRIVGNLCGDLFDAHGFLLGRPAARAVGVNPIRPEPCDAVSRMAWDANRRTVGGRLGAMGERWAADTGIRRPERHRGEGGAMPSELWGL